MGSIGRTGLVLLNFHDSPLTASFLPPLEGQLCHEPRTPQALGGDSPGRRGFPFETRKSLPFSLLTKFESSTVSQKGSFFLGEVPFF